MPVNDKAIAQLDRGKAFGGDDDHQRVALGAVGQPRRDQPQRRYRDPPFKLQNHRAAVLALRRIERQKSPAMHHLRVDRKTDTVWAA